MRAVLTASTEACRESDYQVLRHLVAVSFWPMLVSVAGFCLGLSFFRSAPAVFKTLSSCKPGREGSRARTRLPKALRWLLAGLALLIVAASASATELKIAGGSIEIEFIRSASAAWESVARQWVERSARAISDYYGRFPVAR
jgi:hypothetical protein